MTAIQTTKAPLTKSVPDSINKSILRSEEKRIVPYAETSLAFQKKFESLFNGLLGSESISSFFENCQGNQKIELKKISGSIFLVHKSQVMPLDGEEAKTIFQSLAVDKIVQQKLEQMQAELNNGGSLARIAQPVAVLSDLMSIYRNSASVATPAALHILAMGVASGALSSVTGAIMVVNAALDIHKSGKIGDREGMALASLFGATGASLTGLSVGMVVTKAAALQGATAIASAAGLYVYNPISIAMNVFLMGYASYQMHQLSSFRTDLQESVEAGGVKGGINFLHEQLNLTEVEEASLKLIEDPAKKQSERMRLLECRWARFERRTDKATLQSLLPKISEIKKTFDAGKPDVETLAGAKSILETVLHVNHREMVKTSLLILVAVIGLVATIVGMTVTGGTPALLFALLGVMWLVLDKAGVTDYIAEGLLFLHLRLLEQLDSSLLSTMTSFEEMDEIFDVKNPDFHALITRSVKKLYQRDSGFKSASMERKSQVFISAYGSTWSSCSKFYDQLQEFPEQEKWLDLIDEIRFVPVSDLAKVLAKCGIDNKSPEAALKLSREEWLAENPLLRFLPEGEQLKNAAIYYLHSIYSQSLLSADKANLYKNKSSIQDLLSAEIAHVEEMEVGGKKMKLFTQLEKDYLRHPKIVIADGSKGYSGPIGRDHFYVGSC
jgi:hypothetical protein